MYRTEAKILDQVASFLSDTYNADIRLGAIIYLHRMFGFKLQAPALRNIELFAKLFKPDCLPNISVATTFWDTTHPWFAPRHKVGPIDAQLCWGSTMLSRDCVGLFQLTHRVLGKDLLDQALRDRRREILPVQREM